MLLYTSRGVSGTSCFRTRGVLPLRGMLVSAGCRRVQASSLKAPAGLCSVPTCYGYWSRGSQGSPTALPGLSTPGPGVTANTRRSRPHAPCLPCAGPRVGTGCYAAGQLGAEPPAPKTAEFRSFDFILTSLCSYSDHLSSSWQCKELFHTHAHARAHTHSCKMASHLTAGARPLPHTHVWGPASESCVASGAPCPLRLAKSHQLGPRAESTVYTARAESTVYTARGSRGAPMPPLSLARCDSDCPAVADEQKLSVLRAGSRPSPS